MLETLIEQFGEGAVALAGGALLGAMFGALARFSGFCLRTSVLDIFNRRGGGAAALWLLAAGTAIAGTQGLILAGVVDPATIRLITGSASLSGVIIGGLLFGIGMVLARGCVSRLMVLTAGGNLRALVTLSVFGLAAYATMKGPLGEARAALAGLAQIEGADRLNLTTATGVGALGGLVSGVAVITLALLLGMPRGLTRGRALAGVAIGIAVAAAYGFTALINGISFDPQPVRGLSFIAPAVNSASTLLGLQPGKVDVDMGLAPGVLLGALIVALAGRSFRLEWFASPGSALRYLAGGALMGFGGVLAGGCTMGNGVSGWAVYATGALVGLVAMIIGAGLADALVDRPGASRPAADAARLDPAAAVLSI